MRAILEAVASWHAERATKAYLSGDFEIYAYHIAIADRLRSRFRANGEPRSIRP